MSARFALLLVLLAAACTKNTETTVTNPPAPERVFAVIATVWPAPGLTVVPVDTHVTATFTRALDCATLSGTSFTLATGSGAVDGSVTCADTTATFVPSAPLPAGATVAAVLTPAVKDASGAALAEMASWSFTTAPPPPPAGPTPDTTPPTAAPVSPAASATGVPVDGTVRVGFSEPIDPATINEVTFTLSGAAGDVRGTVAYAGGQAVFTPAAELAPGTVYTARVSTGARDAAGNPMAAPLSWSFTTEQAAVPALPVIAEALPGNGHVLVRWDPVPGATAYDLYYSSAPGVTTRTGVLAAWARSPYPVVGLPADGTSSHFILVARNRWGDSLPSAEVSARSDALSSWTAVGLKMTWGGLTRFGTKLVGFAEPIGGWMGVSEDDGATWRYSWAKGASVRAMAASPSTVVAVGSPGLLLTSTDGLHWTPRTSPDPTGFFTAVTWTGTQFVAVGSYGLAATSPDGIGWTQRDAGTTESLSGVAWSGSLLVAVGMSGRIFTSPDGVAWTEQTSGTTSQFNHVAWVGNRFVAGGYMDYTVESTNGTTWGRNSYTMAFGWTGSHYAVVTNGTTVLSLGTRIFKAAAAGGGWTEVTGIPAYSYKGGVWSGARFVAVAYEGPVLASTTGDAWARVDANPAIPVLRGITTYQGGFVAVGDEGTILTSPDGRTWTRRNSGTTQRLNAVACLYTCFAVGDGGTVVLGAAASWTPAVSGTTANLTAVAANWNPTVIAAGWPSWGYSGPIFQLDGSGAATQVATASAPLAAVAWTGAQFVGVGAGVITTSPTGAAWTERLSQGASGLGGVVKGADGRLLATTSIGPTWASSDGVAWAPMPAGTPGPSGRAAWTGSQLVAAGYGGIATSPDGGKWTWVETPQQLGLYDVAWNGTTAVAVGYGVMVSP